jgi:hypothetical protein
MRVVSLSQATGGLSDNAEPGSFLHRDYSGPVARQLRVRAGTPSMGSIGPNTDTNSITDELAGMASRLLMVALVGRTIRATYGRASRTTRRCLAHPSYVICAHLKAQPNGATEGCR